MVKVHKSIKSGTPQNIQFKMGIIVIVITTLLLILSGAYQYFAVQLRMNKNLSLIGNIAVVRLSKSLIGPIDNLDDQQIKDFVMSELGQKEVHCIIVNDEDDKPIASKIRNERDKIVDLKGAPSAKGLLLYSRPIIKDDEKLGNVDTYVTKKYMHQKLMGILLGIVVKTIIIDFVLLVALILSIKLFVIKPVSKVVFGLMKGIDRITDASSQLSSISQSLALSSSNQAASTEETSASLEQMSSMIAKNAENTKKADTFMKDSNSVVVIAGDSMAELKVSMESTSKSSEETSKIVKTIDEIAFQTNLLALNAAVEAARAGEAGAGFAVVADEVRGLALRAAEAAKSTADLIDNTVKSIIKGSDLVSSTSETFSSVAERTEKVGIIVGNIDEATSEQAKGIEQINRAVADMDKSTQRGAASAKETTNASEKLHTQAEEMTVFIKNLVSLIGLKSEES